MPEPKRTQKELINSLSSALKEVKPLLQGKRPPKDNADEMIALWQKWADELDD